MAHVMVFWKVSLLMKTLPTNIFFLKIILTDLQEEFITENYWNLNHMYFVMDMKKNW